MCVWLGEKRKIRKVMVLGKKKKEEEREMGMELRSVIFRYVNSDIKNLSYKIGEDYYE